MSENEEEEKAKPKEADWGFPGFARDFPDDAELGELVQAFARGDYRTVREGTAKIASSPGASADVKQAAALLRERTTPDPSSTMLFVFAGLLLVFLTGWWVGHDGPEEAKPAPKPAPTIERID